MMLSKIYGKKVVDLTKESAIMHVVIKTTCCDIDSYKIERLYLKDRQKPENVYFEETNKFYCIFKKNYFFHILHIVEQKI